MAASVENRQFGRLEPGFQGVSRPFKPGPTSHHRSDSPVRGCNFPPSADITFPNKPNMNGNARFEYSSSDEDDDDENDYSLAIKKANAELEPSVLDSRDEATADNWVERNPSMVRLTGKHPFNAEAPLPRLMHHGFITPVPLHYVRNHGPVPKAAYEEWTVEVTGLVKRPMRFTMHQLETEFPSREFPVTLVCAGNRRKEQNMVKQPSFQTGAQPGFHLGVAGRAPTRSSEAMWNYGQEKGRTQRVFRRGGRFTRRRRIEIWNEREEGNSHGSGEGYHTCLHAEWREIDAGSWVSGENDNSGLHRRKNGFFIHVDAELANAEAWWYKPEYIINELNINSVITTPCHEEILPINAWTTQRPYTLRGYSYSGGGKKVTRVEVTLDGGETWQVCSLDHPEKPNKYGKYWCWCFWSLEVEVLDLLGAKEIAVRAWDETLNTQPEKLIWNVMVCLCLRIDEQLLVPSKKPTCAATQGRIGIVFEHPTQPGNQSGGWMAKERHLEKSSNENQTLKKSVSSPFMNTTSKTFSISEVKKHNSPDSAWIIVHGHVYDCTRFLKDHPGGTDSILINAGTDCTEEFDAIHSDKAKKMLEDYRIGELITTGYASADSSPNNSVHGPSSNLYLAPIKEVSPTTRSVALVPREKIPCKLVAKTSLSHDVRLFRFALPNEEQVLGLPVGKHIFLCATVDDKLCMRAYTPSSTVDTVGYFELVVKVYFKGVHPKFPNGGQMSQHLDSLELGSSVDVKGPLGHIEYNGKGYFTVHGKQKFAKKLAMIAGGTGITPIYQVMQAILKDPEDDTEMYVVYANRTEDDILLRDELDAWAEKYPDRVKVWYVIQESIKEEEWKYSLGFVTESVLREHIPESSETTLALACGPPPMLQFAVNPNLEKMGYDIKEKLLVF
ncbi:Nitrate reductase [NADH] [Sesamum alatum]|uniref:nitrate reductase (NADH) n=1 Tax=Sesamum alatum TaxID=300844 RepID=A0AAE1YG71_9LAMI|nr:Nitrate reductase [NADH] [Sesamum alatum]